jgi:hypothetical protein
MYGEDFIRSSLGKSNVLPVPQNANAIRTKIVDGGSDEVNALVAGESDQRKHRRTRPATPSARARLLSANQKDLIPASEWDLFYRKDLSATTRTSTCLV